MSGASAWFPCYPNDLLGSMRWKRMTPAQRGAYWQLICWQMQSDDGHFDDDVELLSALADLDLSNGNAIVVEAFPVQENGRRANERALAEWEKRSAISAVRSKVGKAGLAKRWKGHSKVIAKGIAIGSTTTTTTTPIHPQPEPQTEDSSETARKPRRSKPKVPAPAADDILTMIPICGQGEKQYPITHDQAAAWGEDFPSVDVPSTLREIRAWNEANPKRRKTASGVLRHIVSWLTREQNGGR